MDSLTSRAPAEQFHHAGAPVVGDPMARVDADMKHVLDTLAEFGGKSIEMCAPAEARRQPTLERALASILRKQGADPDDDQGIGTEDIVVTGPEGDLLARVYRVLPTAGSPLPIVVYFHGGGFVVGDLDSTDAAPRALARKTGAIVVSVQYRQAPEHRFPAAHDDAWAAWRWIIDNAEHLGGDAGKVAIAGEGAGANLAINVSIRARDEDFTAPVHQVLVTPFAGRDMSRPSYVENMQARPLNSAMMHWFVRHAFADRSELEDLRIDLAARTDLGGLPTTTMVMAELDPLMSEGEALAKALHDADIWVDAVTYDGVPHGFFGLAAIVNKAMFAQAQVARNLTEAFAAADRTFVLD